MMSGLGSFNLINEFERASNEPNAEQLASSLARLQPYIPPAAAIRSPNDMVSSPLGQHIHNY